MFIVVPYNSRVKLSGSVDPAADGAALPDLRLHRLHSPHVAVLLSIVPEGTQSHIVLASTQSYIDTLVGTQSHLWAHSYTCAHT